MRYLLVLSLFLFACSNNDHSAHTPAEHDASSMVLDATPPLAGDYSLYQVESLWRNQTNNEMPLTALSGHIQVVAMTYTHCEVSCPRIVSSMKDIQKAVGDDVRFTLISIDPDRDTVSRLEAYAGKMNLEAASWNLLNGQSDDVLEIAALLGVRFQKMPDGEFAHSNIITVLDEEGVIVHQQNGIAPDLTRATIAAVQNLLSQEEAQ